jgi:hypothetical protein
MKYDHILPTQIFFWNFVFLLIINSNYYSVVLIFFVCVGHVQLFCLEIRTSKYQDNMHMDNLVYLKL